jgi:hypothetical protein
VADSCEEGRYEREERERDEEKVRTRERKEFVVSTVGGDRSA